MECSLHVDSREVATSIAGYIAKKLFERTECDRCKLMLIADEKGVANDQFLKSLSREGLTVPSSPLAEFVCCCVLRY